MQFLPWVLGVLVAVVVILLVRWILSMRRVVNPSEVHIVMRQRTTDVYGDADLIKAGSKDGQVSEYAGNVYYEVPSWVPKFGVSVRVLQSVNFPVNLNDYRAYDQDKVPFLVDVTAFFRIEDFRRAASRIVDDKSLREHLSKVVQGAVRSILAKDKLEAIMVNRATYGQQFTEAVKENLKEWGIAPVQAVELMDVRDVPGEEVIENIMRRRKSGIEKESRMEVAQNQQLAREAEIKAEQAVALMEQEKLQTVGERTAEQQQKVGIAKEQAEQNIQEQKRITTEKEMEVLRVETVQKAEISKQETVINTEADQQRQAIEAETAVKVAEKTKQAETIAAEQRVKVAEQDRQAAEFNAEAQLVQKKKEAEGKVAVAEADAKAVKMQGEAEGAKIKATRGAEAETEAQLNEASVRGKIMLAQQIGENDGYQKYLIAVRQVEANENVGIEQAKALAAALSQAGIKIVATPGGSGSGSGLSSILDLFGPMGGQKISGLLETLEGTELGGQLLKKVGLGTTAPAEQPAEAPEGKE